MTFLTILIGLIGLGIIVFIHELGHFIAARLSGIDVEAFAIGWGKKIKSYTRNGVEYRLNVFPIGGYCKMKGEDEFRRAIELKYSSFPKEPGSLFAARPVKRFLTYFAGPLFNLIFAVLLFSIVWGIGFDYATTDNRIVLSSDLTELHIATDENSSAVNQNPADISGLKSGDYIVRLGNNEINTFYDIQTALMTAANTDMPITYIRDGITYQSTIIPDLDKSTGSGIIGIYSWIEPVIEYIPQDAAPELSAGFRVGDKITAINNMPINHILEFYNEAVKYHSFLEVLVERDGKTITLKYTPSVNEQGQKIIQLIFPSKTIINKADNIFQAVSKGITETISTFSTAFLSIRTLFMGVDMRQTLAGPIRITYLVGEATAEGFRSGFVTGIRTLLHLLGFISVALGFANLLPIPALDGGQMIISAYEGISRREIAPRRYYILQIAGFAILFTILIFTVFNDIISFF